MSKFNVVYSYETTAEISIEAKNETEAFKLFRKYYPDVDFEDMWEVSEIRED